LAGANPTAAQGFDGPAVRMEDGFIRSRGLGSDFFGALSVALDDQGVYYDPTRPSRLESLIEAGEPPAEALDRAARLRGRIVEAGLSKYNLKGAAPAGWPTDRERVLVVGQVENDKSILMGCEPGLDTNSALVAAARADHPHALIIYRNHPDVLAGNRPGRLDASAEGAIDISADGLDIIDCLDACDRLDFPRRTRRASLDALVHAALIDYPVYVTPEGWPCEVEDLVEALIAARDAPPPAAPANQIARWWKGLRASLDRTPPPSY